MRKYYLFTLTFSFFFFSAFAGKLLIIGGGSELSSAGAWNKAPYTWAVDQSSNKRVAVIAYSSATNWIPDYFMNECGAVAAKNFTLSSQAIADSQETYDSLMTYDVIFLKGGDQYDYYSTYKNTLTHQAIQDKFEEGGVICGTSAGLAVMSEVLFTARNGTVYPDECLEDPDNYYVTLANDFLQLFGGYIFDSHFSHRGRFPRLTGFLANWKFDEGETISGIGVDEQTALAIDENNIGTVYGTGCANIYIPSGEDVFHKNGDKLIADSVRVIQLLHGCTYDFNNGEVNGFDSEIIPAVMQETGNFTVLLSGGETLGDNTAMLDNFYGVQGSADDAILLLTGSNTSQGNAFKDYLEDLGASPVYLYSALPENGNDASLAGAIKFSPKILIVNNLYETFSDFVFNTENGGYLQERLREDGVISAFVGDNSRFAGKTVVNNYLTPNASYNNNLSFDPGLAVLETTVVMPRTFDDNDMYENAVTGVPFAMIKDSLAYGIWLNDRNYALYKPEDGKTYITSYGGLPMMVLKNKGCTAGFAGQTPTGTGTKYRQIAGFNAMILSILDDPYRMLVGDHITFDISEENPADPVTAKVYPNPGNDRVTVEWAGHSGDLSIYSITGQKVAGPFWFNETFVVITSGFPEGNYLLKLTSGKNDLERTIKLTIKNK